MNPNYVKQVKPEPEKLIEVGIIYAIDQSDLLFSIVVTPKKNGKL